MSVLWPSKRARRWQLLSILGVAACVGVYVGHLRQTPNPNGGTLLGLALGAVGTLLILVLVGFGVRKRSYRSTWGTLDGWLQAHIYLGLATVPVVLLHTGFRFEDLLATSALVVMLLVVSSGLLGAALYTAVPRKLTVVSSGSDDPEETAERIRSLTRSMAQLASQRSAAFRNIHGKLENDALPGPAAGWRLVLLGGGERPGSGGPEKEFGPLLSLVDAEEREALRKLLVLARQRRELHQRLRFRQRYKNLLESWLWLHVPLTGLLVALLAVHIVAALWFRGLAP